MTYAQQYYVANRDRILERSRKRRQEKKAEIRLAQKAWRAANPAHQMFIRTKARAKARGIEFTITMDDVVVPEVCPVLHIPLVVGDQPHLANSPSLDRIDNAKGYVPGNVIVISNRANYLKKDATSEELRLLAEFYS